MTSNESKHFKKSSFFFTARRTSTIYQKRYIVEENIHCMFQLKDILYTDIVIDQYFWKFFSILLGVFLPTRGECMGDLNSDS